VQRLTQATARTLATLLQSPRSWRHGYDLMKESDVASGTLYPLLDRLLSDKWLETRWEDSPLPGRPRRHLYRLTVLGRSEALRALEALPRARVLKFGLSPS